MALSCCPPRPRPRDRPVPAGLQRGLPHAMLAGAALSRPRRRRCARTAAPLRPRSGVATRRPARRSATRAASTTRRTDARGPCACSAAAAARPPRTKRRARPPRAPAATCIRVLETGLLPRGMTLPAGLPAILTLGVPFRLSACDRQITRANRTSCNQCTAQLWQLWSHCRWGPPGPQRAATDSSRPPLQAKTAKAGARSSSAAAAPAAEPLPAHAAAAAAPAAPTARLAAGRSCDLGGAAHGLLAGTHLSMSVELAASAARNGARPARRPGSWDAAGRGASTAQRLCPAVHMLLAGKQALGPDVDHA